MILGVWAFVAISSAVVALFVVAPIASIYKDIYDEDITGFWYHAPLLVAAAPIAPLLLLAGRESTPERPLRWLAWATAAVGIGFLGLVSLVLISIPVLIPPD